MGTESTNADAFSDSMKEKIADCMWQDEDAHGLDVGSMSDQELFRRAMMYGLLDEDAGGPDR